MRGGVRAGIFPPWILDLAAGLVLLNSDMEREVGALWDVQGMDYAKKRENDPA